ncbi:MAG: hypothetical protein K1X72_04285 [Pyrinomonadaceae bacterium]|nr:hypothetical protein [Pyrinomonadaceae bacterium]
MSMLASATIMRELFDIAPETEIPNTRLNRYVGAASRRIKKWVGNDAYTDALSNAPTDADRKEDLIVAEANLAMHFAILGLNAPITSKGVVKTAGKLDASLRTYLTPAETEQLRTQFLENAESLVKDYLVIGGETVFEFVGCE